MGREFPEVVGLVLDTISEHESFRDYRIIGNTAGTTIVIRYSMVDMVHEQRFSPLWQHRSAVNLTRDHMRQNKWIREHSELGVDNVIHGSWSSESGITDGAKCQWNVNAQVFTPAAPKEYVDNESQTDPVAESKSMETQTALLPSMTSVGTQCETETRSIGTVCKIRCQVKGKSIQATVGMKNQGVNATVSTDESTTQSEKYIGRVSTTDVAVGCVQSPGAISRHVQTYAKKFVEVKTNTKYTETISVGTETDKGMTLWSDIVESETSSTGASQCDLYAGVDKQVEKRSTPRKGDVIADPGHPPPKVRSRLGIKDYLKWPVFRGYVASEYDEGEDGDGEHRGYDSRYSGEYGGGNGSAYGGGGYRGYYRKYKK